MKGFLKWCAIIVGVVVTAVILIALLVPLFVDMDSLKPRIEKIAADATGRPLKLGGDISLSLFPWAGIRLTDVSLGNPAGFSTDTFASFSKFDVQVKLLPLLSRDIQVKHLVLKGLRLTLEKNKKGDVNWAFGKAANIPPTELKAPRAAPGDGLPIAALAVGEVSVIDGRVVYTDVAGGVQRTVSDLSLTVKDISFDKAVQLSLSARLDGQPLRLSGAVGPLGAPPGKGRVPLDLVAGVFDQLEVRLTGEVRDLTDAAGYDLTVSAGPFSARRLMAAAFPAMTLKTRDTGVLETVSFRARVAGDARKVAVSEGRLVVDDTTTTFSARVNSLTGPDLTWDIKVDTVDLDRYLPPAKEEKTAASSGTVPSKADTRNENSAGIDYAPLRSLKANGAVAVGRLKGGGAVVTDLSAKVTAGGGKLALRPLTMNLYGGSMTLTADTDVTADLPDTRVRLDMDGVQAGPLLNDVAGRKFLTGTTVAQVSLSMKGDTPVLIKKSLDGQGDVVFKDGALYGLDLVGMLRNIKTAFTGSAVGDGGTKFAALHSLFEIKAGVLKTALTTLTSPVLRVKATGTADLVTEALRFRVVPTYVDPTRKEADRKGVDGNLIPILVSGTFSKPTFRPDIEKAATQAAEKLLKDAIGSQRGKKKKNGSGSADGATDAVNELFKQLPFGK